MVGECCKRWIRGHHHTFYRHVGSDDVGLPVATLDYGNSPAYVQPAWRITARKHIPEVVAELLKPAEPSCFLQDTTLHDSLECSTPATPRLVRLILEMMECGRLGGRKGRPLRFPGRMLEV